MRKIILYIVLLFSLYGNSQLLSSFDRLRQQQINGEIQFPASSSILYNFRIEPTQTNRLYFDYNEAVSTSVVAPSSITISNGINVTSGVINTDGLGNYLELNGNVTPYDNITIRHESSSISINGESLPQLDLHYIINKIPLPNPLINEIYVDKNATGLNNGTSEIDAYTTIQQAVTEAVAGSKIWIKAANYGAEIVTTINSGTIVNPIQIEGYKTTPGDITTMYYNYGDGALDSSEMPLIDGGDRNAGYMFNFEPNDSYIHLKNIQFTNAERAINQAGDGAVGCIFDNILIKDVGTSTTEGYGIRFVGTTSVVNNDNNRFLNITVINASHMTLIANGNSNYIENLKSYCDEYDSSNPAGLTTDYYCNLTGNYNITRNSLADKKVNEGHDGHGFGTKHASEYNLIEFCLAINIQDSFIARESGSKYNVFRDCEAHADVPYRHIPTGTTDLTVGISWLAGGTDNIFDRMHIHHLDNAVWAVDNAEDFDGSGGGSNNIIKNSLFHDLRDFLRSRNGTPVSTAVNNNKFYNNTFVNIENLFKIYTVNAGVTFLDNEFKNNIFSNVTNLNIAPDPDFVDMPVGGVIFDYNAFHGSFAPQGTNTFANDPLFVSATDFRLRTTSPFLDSGTTITNVDFDYLKDARPDGTGYSLGAYEKGVDVQPPVTTYPVFEEASVMAISLSSSTITVNYPSNIIQDDILIMTIQIASNQTVTTPVGWNLMHSENIQAQASSAMFWKRSSGTEGLTEIVTKSGTDDLITTAIMYRFSGCINVGTPYEVLEVQPYDNEKALSFSHTSLSQGDTRLSVMHTLQENDLPVVSNSTGYTLVDDQSTGTASDARMSLETQEILNSATLDGKSLLTLTNDAWVSKVAYYLIPSSNQASLEPELNNLYAWYDASDNLTIEELTTTGRVSKWNDKSGLDNHLLNPTISSRQPYTNTRQLNGLNVVDFQGNQHLKTSPFSVALTGSITFIMVVNRDFISGSWNQYLMDGHSSSARKAYLLNNGVNYITGGVPVSEGIPPDNIPYICVLQFDSSLGRLIESGNIILNNRNLGANQLTGLNVGSSYVPSGYLDGFIGEFFMYDSYATDAEINKTAQYLADKWGLTWTDL